MEIQPSTIDATPFAAKSYLQVEKTQLDLDQLQERIDELRQLCQEIDPYSPLSENDKQILAKHHIYDCFDPFSLTNKLILALEDALEEWHRRSNIPLE